MHVSTATSGIRCAAAWQPRGIRAGWEKISSGEVGCDGKSLRTTELMFSVFIAELLETACQAKTMR